MRDFPVFNGENWLEGEAALARDQDIKEHNNQKIRNYWAEKLKGEATSVITGYHDKTWGEIIAKCRQRYGQK